MKNNRAAEQIKPLCSEKEKREDAALGETLVLAYYRTALACGWLKPTDDRKNVSRYFKKVFRELKKYGAEWSVDHRSSILEQARNFKRDDNIDEAILFYATWFEHWVNGLIRAGFMRKSFHPNDYKQLIRSVNLKVKFSCIPQILDFPEINQKHTKAVFDICDARNSYVHYKFEAFDEDKEDHWKPALLLKAEKAVAYLKRYEQKNLYAGVSESKIALPKE